MELIYTSISCWETWGGGALVCVQQPEVVKRQQRSQTIKYIEVLLQKEQQGLETLTVFHGGALGSNQMVKK